MIDKSYFDNMNSKNVLQDYSPKDMSSYVMNNFDSENLENMILNSNLENQNSIK